jgi:hypothetical protein
MNRMAGGPHGLELSGAVIIMDFIAIKYFRFMQIAFNAFINDDLNCRQDHLIQC